MIRRKFPVFTRSKEPPSALDCKSTGALAVLCYHQVGLQNCGTHPGLIVGRDHFREQMLWLSKHEYRTVRQTDLLKWLSSGAPLPPKPVLLTFDDGYEDLHSSAFPILRELNFTATVFLVTGRSSNAWDHGQGRGELALLSIAQVQHWAARGIEFGGHTRLHVNLETVSQEEQEREILGCAEDLTNILGDVPLSFAYPYGAHTPCSRAAAERVFRLGFTVEEGRNYPGADAMLLRRTNVLPSDTKFDFACRVRCGFSPVQRLRRAVGLRTWLAKLSGRRAS